MEARNIVLEEKLQGVIFTEILTAQLCYYRNSKWFLPLAVIVVLKLIFLNKLLFDSAGSAGAERVDPLKVILNSISISKQERRRAYRRKRNARQNSEKIKYKRGPPAKEPQYPPDPHTDSESSISVSLTSEDSGNFVSDSDAVSNSQLILTSLSISTPCNHAANWFDTITFSDSATVHVHDDADNALDDDDNENRNGIQTSFSPIQKYFTLSTFDNFSCSEFSYFKVLNDIRLNIPMTTSEFFEFQLRKFSLTFCCDMKWCSSCGSKDHLSFYNGKFCKDRCQDCISNDHLFSLCPKFLKWLHDPSNIKYHNHWMNQIKNANHLYENFWNKDIILSDCAS